jgi:DNA (cytosine-5)-methyltransferase 1
MSATETAAVAAERDELFLVENVVTLASDRCEEYVLDQQSGSRPRPPLAPLPMTAMKRAIGLYSPDTFALPRNGTRGELHSNATYRPENRPLHTATAHN